MDGIRITLPLFVLLLLLLQAKRSVVEAVEDSSTLRCTEKERNALLAFKEGLNDTSNCLSSWVGEDCCAWLGVGCSNQTGHVTEIDLHSQYFFSIPTEQGNKAATIPCTLLRLSGKLSPSLLDLEYLTHLDLSGNDFQGIPIPSFVGSLRNLTYLDLSDASFGGTIPPNIGNLSRLSHLGLASSLYPYNLRVSNLLWLPNLYSLQYLNLRGINLSSAASYWLQAINMLPSLSELYLSSCELPNLPQHLPFVNFTSLRVLILSRNNFVSPIPSWVLNISTIEELGFYNSQLTGNIPEVALGNLCNLQTLDLSVNHLTGDINQFIEAMSQCGNSSLWSIELGGNKLEGNLPDTIGSFRRLMYLELAQNSFSGPIPASIGNLSRLGMLDLSFNKLSGNIPVSIGQLPLKK